MGQGEGRGERCGFACFGHELLAVLLADGNHELVDAHGRVLQSVATLQRGGRGGTIATFLPKKFLISLALMAEGHWSEIRVFKSRMRGGNGGQYF